MNLPVPPTPVRRTLREPVYLVGALALVLLLSALAVVTAPTALWARSRPVVRIVLACLFAVLLDVTIALSCWWISLRHSRRRDADAWRRAHMELLESALRAFVDRCSRWSGLQLRVEGDATLSDGSGAYLVLGNHAGVGDSILLAHVTATYLRRTPRIMLKRMLLWDPAMDYLLGRLDAYFLPPARVPYADRQRALAEFVASVRPAEAALIFPEGRNWTPRRKEAELAQALAAGDPTVVDWHRSHPHVLRPRDGGVVRVLAARPDVRPVVLAQRGLQHLTGIGPVWDWLAEPTPTTIAVLAADGLTSNDTQVWLDQQWGRINDWLAEPSSR